MAGIHSSPVDATELQAAALFYSEPSRVTGFEAIVEGREDFGSGRVGALKFVIDALTGASASGAVPSQHVQTFTRPSGVGSYTVVPGDTPLDDTFRDTRGALHASFTLPLTHRTRATAGVVSSIEHDYLSMGGNLALSRDFNKRNTTLDLGLSYSYDTIFPEGGRPVAFASMAPAGQPQPRLNDDGRKHVFDLVAGVVQVLDRSTIAHFNYSLTHLSGYQTDPYKIVSLVDPTTGDPLDQLYESRPEARTKHVIYGQVKHYLRRDLVDASYRFMVDDWNVRSHTIDLNYRFMAQPHRYLQPHLRYYHQSAADFYTRWLEDGQLLPQHATADYRLGTLTGWTVGGRYGQVLTPSQTLIVRVEYYWQAGDGSPPGAPGALANFDLFPTVGAWIVHVGYTIGL